MQKNNNKIRKNKLLFFTRHLLSERSGFTLVELLVAIGVIATIMAVVVTNFMGARERARDTRRKNDLTQIQKALELYKLDQSPPSYPADATLNDADLCSECWSSGADCSGNVYMRGFPCDPVSSTPYTYARGSDILQYSMIACLENPVDPDRDDPVVAPCDSGTGVSYTINEP